MAGLTFGKLVRKYSAVVFFPSVTAASIYADWSHTRNWKRQILEAEQLKNKNPIK